MATAGVPPTEPGQAIRAFVAGLGLLDDPAQARFSPLTGGVSSDIWLVAGDRLTLCVKRALAQLKVTAEWHAPIERNAYEAAWLRDVAHNVPGAAPALLGEDRALGMFAMEYLPPEQFLWWKGELLAGRVDQDAAKAVGRTLAAIHASFARDPSAAARFATDANFHAIRLEPYLLATAVAHPECRAALQRLSERTAATRHTVIHGDVSPKNILIGPRGPVLLDAECAWFGDPAFDLAFCLNHLLLKCIPAPQAAGALADAFRHLADTYLQGVDWEDRQALEGRAATLLPGLLLARVDGKSPVEYLTADADKDRVRRAATTLLMAPPRELADVQAVWAYVIGERKADGA